jgi:hypothetical protein
MITYVEFQFERKVAPPLLTSDLVFEFVNETVTRRGGRIEFPHRMEEFSPFFEKSLPPNQETLRLFHQYAVRFFAERRQTRSGTHPLQSLAQTVVSCPRLFSKLSPADLQVV